MGERASTQSEALLLAALERGENKGGVTRKPGTPQLWRAVEVIGRGGRDRAETGSLLLSSRGRPSKGARSSRARAKGMRASSWGAQESRRGHSGEGGSARCESFSLPQ
jgi:hypothetical protein